MSSEFHFKNKYLHDFEFDKILQTSQYKQLHNILTILKVFKFFK